MMDNKIGIKERDLLKNVLNNQSSREKKTTFSLRNKHRIMIIFIKLKLDNIRNIVKITTMVKVDQSL